MSIDCNMICYSRNRRRYSTWSSLLIHTTHHVIHGSSDILTNRSTNSHTCHHSSHVESCAIATTNINITCTIGTHLAKGICTSNTDLCMLLNLECTKISSLSLLMLCILTFFTLNAKSTFIVFSFNSLFSMNVSNFCFGFCFCGSSGKVFGHTHELTVTIAGFINFNRTNINARHNNTESFFQPFTEIIFHNIVNLCSFAFNLNDRNVVSRRSIGNHIFNIAINRITDLFLKIIQIKCAQSM